MTEDTVQTTALSRTSTNLAVRPGFHSVEGFKFLKEMATIFSNSGLVPIQFKASPANALVACELACRLQMSPLQVMQNLYIVNGKPAWSSQFLVSLWNSCGRFSPIRYEWVFDGERRVGCKAVSTEYETGAKLEGAAITMKMAQSEGWTQKTGSKWQTMPEQMFMYRAAAFLVRAFAPELALGMHTADELQDVYGQSPEPANIAAFSAVNSQASNVVTSVNSSTTADIEGSEILDAEVSAVMDSANVVNSATQSEDRPVEPVSSETTRPVDRPATKPAETKESNPPAALGTATEEDNPPVHRETLLSISELLKAVNPPREVWSKLLNSLGVDKASMLTESDAGRVVAWLRKKKDQIELDQFSASITGRPGNETEVAAGTAVSFL